MEQTDDEAFATVADVEFWVQQHGRRRLRQLMLSGRLKGNALQAVRAWLTMQEERLHRATVMLAVAFGMAVVVAGIAHWFRW